MVGFSPLTRLSSKPSLVSGPWTRAGCHAGAVLQIATRWHYDCLMGVYRPPGAPHYSLGSPTPGPGSWLRAAAWQPRAGGGWRVVWGFNLPGGPTVLYAEQTFGPDVGNMRNQFTGELSSQTSHLWAGGRIPVAPQGLRGSSLENQRLPCARAQGQPS